MIPVCFRMEEDQHFCLKWNNYQSNMTAVFDQLRENEAFVDVTLACEGSQLKAHKVRDIYYSHTAFLAKPRGDHGLERSLVLQLLNE